MKNIVILISGRGSNFEALLEASRAEQWESAVPARIAAVISNRPLAKGLETARREGIDAIAVDHTLYPDRESFEEELGRVVDRYNPDLIVLAGFMRILTEKFVKPREGRILNIHPALLPLFKGLNTHERALEAGVRVHGSTVHFVSAALDGGAIIGQAVVPVLPSDTPDTLAARGLKLEHVIDPKVCRAVLEDRVKLVDGKAVMDDETARSLAVFSNEL